MGKSPSQLALGWLKDVDGKTYKTHQETNIIRNHRLLQIYRTFPPDQFWETVQVRVLRSQPHQSIDPQIHVLLSLHQWLVYTIPSLGNLLMFAGVPMSGHPCNARNPKDVLHVLRIYRCNSRNHLSRGCQGPLWKCQPKTKLEAGRLRYIVRTDLFGSFKPPENLSFWLPCDKRTTAAHMPPWKKR